MYFLTVKVDKYKDECIQDFPYGEFQRIVRIDSDDNNNPLYRIEIGKYKFVNTDQEFYLDNKDGVLEWWIS